MKSSIGTRDHIRNGAAGAIQNLNNLKLNHSSLFVFLVVLTWVLFFERIENFIILYPLNLFDLYFMKDFSIQYSINRFLLSLKFGSCIWLPEIIQKFEGSFISLIEIFLLNSVDLIALLSELKTKLFSCSYYTFSSSSLRPFPFDISCI